MLAAGSPGLADPDARAERAARDDALAATLRGSEQCRVDGRPGLEAFVDRWYQLPMWDRLRASPRFGGILQQRRHATNADRQCDLAAVLAASSPGRAPAVDKELAQLAAGGCLPPLLLVAGREDGKFVGIARSLAAQLAPLGSSSAASAGPQRVTLATVPGAGHAVHIERPAELLDLLLQFSEELR